MYSPQTIINPTNVGSLKLSWFTQLGGVAGTPVVTNGIVYVTALNHTIYALNETTGKIIWADGPRKQTGLRYSVNVDVTIDQGNLITATTKNQLVSLDARTGKKNWNASLIRDIVGSCYAYNGGPQATPLVYNGEVIFGMSPADNGARGFVRAYDESNGALLWTFYTVPPCPITSSNQAFYQKSWGTDDSGCSCGGGAVWNLPALDPKRGIIYFGTGNPSPPSANKVFSPNPTLADLYTDSVIALNATDGNLIWYFQETLGDRHDYDQGMPVQVFTTTINGVETEVVGAGSKNGYYYELDAADGSLIHKTSLGIHAGSGKGLYPNGFGGVNSLYSYDPITNMIYVTAYNVDFKISAPINSTLYAINASTGQTVWSSFILGLGGGASSTNNLVFVADGTQHFLALDAQTGQILWKFADTSGGYRGALWSWGPASIVDGEVFETMIGPTGGVIAFLPSTV